MLYQLLTPHSVRCRAIGSILVAAALAIALPVSAQNDSFGVQSRADAAERLIVLAVQQAIGSLPPASAQSVSFVFDPITDSYVRSEQIGPIVLRSPRTLPPGQLSFRLSTSYFELDERFGPIDYEISGLTAEGNRTRFGLSAEARVGVVNLSSTYGLVKNVELSLNLPVVVTDTNAKEIFVSRVGDEPPRPFPVPLQPADLIDRGIADGRLVVVDENLNDLGADFQQGTQGGLGRVDLGIKAAVYASKRMRLALASDLLLPSPNEDELAGSKSTAWSIRILTEVPLPRRASAFVDAGYEYDFEQSTLSRFVWDAGVSFTPVSWFAADVGLGGAQYTHSIEWTPSHATVTRTDGVTATFRPLEDNTLGTTFVDLLLGMKVMVSADVVISAAATVPLTSDGFRPDVAGTLGVEWYL